MIGDIRKAKPMGWEYDKDEWKIESLEDDLERLDKKYAKVKIEKDRQRGNK